MQVYIRGLSKNYPENDYNFFNINGIYLIFYMQIEQFIRNIFAYFYNQGWYIIWIFKNLVAVIDARRGNVK